MLKGLPSLPGPGSRPKAVCPLSGGQTASGATTVPPNLQQALDASKNCQVMLVIGTSAIVQPAASLALEAKSGGAVVAEINLEKTPHSHFMDFALLGKAGEIVPRLVEDWA